ncbi:hypothetical protein IAE33_003272 [Pseudomonas sp. S60]|uniref:hypothetical protein n=1 Tax=unclassified Pseudomonas TaxID=196821 RepID=UPI001911955C|nr:MULTISPECIES: hypothetical protein [unclassified Pseudomonas]MBK5006269.1 hypothetical protein [Pseudomonas sp. S32]MBK5011412.1 hypothetical protein [Pseudomonas sp. S60]
MSYYQFQPYLCFNARCWWHPAHVAAAAQVDPDTSKTFVPVWATVNSGDRDDGWVRCGRLPAYPEADGVLCERFWFGVYRIGEQYVYDIRPAYSGRTLGLWPQLERVLDSNIDGYLGLYGVPADPYPWDQPTAPLWQLDGLDPERLAPGLRRFNLTLCNPSGKTVRRIEDFTRAYLNDWKGVRGLVTLEITEVPVPPHPRPQG